MKDWREKPQVARARERKGRTAPIDINGKHVVQVRRRGGSRVRTALK